MQLLINPIAAFFGRLPQGGKATLLGSLIIGPALFNGFLLISGNTAMSHDEAPLALLLLTLFCLVAIYLLLGWHVAARRSLSAIHHAGQQANRGDLKSRALLESNDELTAIAQQFNTLTRNTEQLDERVGRAADELDYTAKRIHQHANHVSNRVTEQSGAVQKTAAAVEELSSSIEQVAEQASETADISTQAGKLSSRGESTVQGVADSMRQLAQFIAQTNQKMEQLQQRTTEILRSAALVEDIANQTNLLALNAAIEAARAGDHGSGFAVVADEVRQLASTTSSATQEINANLEAIEKDVAAAVALTTKSDSAAQRSAEEAEAAAKLLADIKQDAQRAVARTQETAEITQQQSSAINEIAENVAHIAMMAEENSTTTVDTLEMAAYLQQLALGLKQVARRN